jgi:hypothetical protein
MLDAVVVLALVAFFLLAPALLGYGTRSVRWAVGFGVALTTAGAVSQAVNTNLPGLAMWSSC